MRRWVVLLGVLVWCPFVEARNKTVNNPFTGRPDYITDVTAAGDVTGTSLALTNLVCTASQSLSTDSGGNLICTAGSGGGTVTNVATGTGLTGGPITGTGTISLVTPVTVSNGGTGDTTLTSNGVLYGNGTGALSVTAQGGSNSVLTASAGAPSFSASPTVTSLTATGTVTGVNLDISGQEKFGRFTVANAYLNVGAGSVVTGTTIVNCADTGGNHLNYNNDTNAWSCGTTSSGGGTNHNLLSSTHPDTVTASPIRGDLVVANSTPAWARFAVGASPSVLTANGTDPSWSVSPTVTNLTANNTVTGPVVDAATVENTGAANAGNVRVRDSLNADNTVTGLVVDMATLENTTAVNSGNVRVRDSLTLTGAVTGTALAMTGLVCSSTQILSTDSGGNLICTAPKQTRCVDIENLKDTDDNMPIALFDYGVTVTSVGCTYVGTGTTPATFTLQNGTGATMTIGGTNPTCVAHGTTASFAPVTAGNVVTAGTVIRFNTTNTPAPTSDTYTLCLSYTVP